MTDEEMEDAKRIIENAHKVEVSVEFLEKYGGALNELQIALDKMAADCDVASLNTFVQVTTVFLNKATADGVANFQARCEAEQLPEDKWN